MGERRRIGTLLVGLVALGLAACSESKSDCSPEQVSYFATIPEYATVDCVLTLHGPSRDLSFDFPACPTSGCTGSASGTNCLDVDHLVTLSSCQRDKTTIIASAESGQAYAILQALGTSEPDFRLDCAGNDASSTGVGYAGQPCGR
ncbi:MAG: hypothetical protein ABI551_18255 [Polyangiaceae bacterium]